MSSGVFVLLTDRPNRSQALAVAIDMIGECIVADLKAVWSRLEDVRAVVADVSISNPEVRGCLHALQSSFKTIGQPPLLLLTRWSGEAEHRASDGLGVSTYLSANSDPRMIAACLLKQVSPELSLADTVVAREVGRAEATLKQLLDGARASGRIDISEIGRGIDPVLSAIREGGLDRWLELVWKHHDATFQHCLLVAGLTASFAASLGFSLADQRMMTRAALVHDIGKAKVPLSILNKPGKLDSDEQLVMKAHPVLGYDILVASGERDPILLAITKHHHELLDGTGYPDGLSGRAISDPIRILTICDIYAALIERRSYKPAIEPEQALRILQAMNGKLESALVNAFAMILPAKLQTSGRLKENSGESSRSASYRRRGRPIHGSSTP